MSAADHIRDVARAIMEANLEAEKARKEGGLIGFQKGLNNYAARAAYLATLKAIRDDMYNTDDVDVIDALIAEAEG
jgi:hypothetical protein